MRLLDLLSLPTTARELILGGKFTKYASGYRAVCKDFKDAFDSTVSEAHLKLGEEAVERLANGQASPLARFPGCVNLTIHLDKYDDYELLTGLALFGTTPEARQRLTRVCIVKHHHGPINSLRIVEVLLASQLSGLEELELDVSGNLPDNGDAAQSSARLAILSARLAEGLPRLRRLRLPVCSAKDLEHLRPLSGCAQLRELVLVMQLGGEATTRGLEVLQQLSQLEQLTLRVFDLSSERSREFMQQLMSSHRPPGVRRLTLLLNTYPYGGACITYQQPHPPPPRPPRPPAVGLAMPSTAAAAQGAGAGAAAAATAMPPGPSSASAATAAGALLATVPGAPLSQMHRVELNGFCHRQLETPAVVLAAADRLGQRSIPELVIDKLIMHQSGSTHLRPDEALPQLMPQLVARCLRVEWRCLSLARGQRMSFISPVLALLGLPQSLELNHGEWSWRDDVMGVGSGYRQAAAMASAAAASATAAGAATTAGATAAAGAAGSAAAEQPPRPPLDLDLSTVDSEWVVRKALDRLWARRLGKQAGQGGDGASFGDGCSSDDGCSSHDSDGSDDDSGSDSDSGSSSSGAAAAAGGSGSGGSSAHVGGVGPALVILRGVLPPQQGGCDSFWYDYNWEAALRKCFGRLDQSTKRRVSGPCARVVIVPPARTAMVECASRTDAAALLALLRPGMERRVAVVPVPPGESAIPHYHLRQCVSEVRCMGWHTRHFAPVYRLYVFRWA